MGTTVRMGRMESGGRRSVSYISLTGVSSGPFARSNVVSSDYLYKEPLSIVTWMVENSVHIVCMLVLLSSTQSRHR